VVRVNPGQPSLPSVGLTALGVAAIRAAESTRPDRLFDDPCAAGFVRASGYVRPDGDAPSEGQLARRRRLTEWIAVRTRFLDEVVDRACAGPCRQVVVLGAGLDCRAFRLDWPHGTRLWELDLADVVAFKEMVVRAEGWEPRCERFVVPVDLSGDWTEPLIAAGFDADAPVVWLAEGLLAYLSPEVRDALVRRTSGLSVPGSRIGLTLAAKNRLEGWRRDHPDGTASPGDYVALWQSTAPDDPIGWLASLGWYAELFDVVERAASYGRPLEESAGTSHGARLVDATVR
jgi:methyltransferase (TIGR00027 family)